jgi:hypothetical protein
MEAHGGWIYCATDGNNYPKNTLNLMGSQEGIWREFAFGNSLAFQAQIEDLRLKCGTEKENPKNKRSGSTHRTNWEALLSQTFASMDRNEFREASAASANGTCQRSSGRSGGALPPARLLMIRLTWILSVVVSFTIFAVSWIVSGSSMLGTILSNGKAFA